MTHRRIAWLVGLVTAWSPIAARAQQPEPEETAPAPPGGPSSWTPVPPVVTPASAGAMPVPGVEEAAPSGMPLGRRQVYVHLRTDDARARIDRVVGGTTVPVCFAPCLKVLDAESVYVIHGDGVRSTAQFVLPDDREFVTLDVHAGSSVRAGVGTLMTVVGLAGVWGALEVLQLGPFVIEDRTARIAAVVGLASLPVMVIGILLVAGSRTSVTSSTGSTFTQGSAPPRRRSRMALTPRGLEF